MKAVICDGRISEKIERSLLKHGYFPIKLPPCPTLPQAISSHPDSLICRVGDNIITTCEYGEIASYVFSDIREFAPHVKIHFIDEDLGSSYPADARLNAVTVSNNIITNTKSISDKILKFSKNLGFYAQNVNQGYPNCSILKLNEENVITADKGICKKLSTLGINVLLIEPGHILLPPYEFGFIGGASGVDENHVFFLGNLDLHPAAEQIRKHIERLEMVAISLSDEPLCDLGGLIFI